MRFSYFTPGEIIFVTHWMGAWVGSRASSENRQIFAPFRESNPVRPVRNALLYQNKLSTTTLSSLLSKWKYHLRRLCFKLYKFNYTAVKFSLGLFFGPDLLWQWRALRLHQKKPLKWNLEVPSLDWSSHMANPTRLRNTFYSGLFCEAVHKKTVERRMAGWWWIGKKLERRGHGLIEEISLVLSEGKCKNCHNAMKTYGGVVV
jgi:hypothetical protein